jgi:hypothetical protein
MATKYEIDLAINAASTASTVKDVKSSLKELNSLALKFGEGSAEFEKVTAAAGDLKDRIDDVNQAISAKKGTGFEKFGGELGILGDKLSGLDFKGANESIGRISQTIKGVSFKDISEGVKGFTSVLGNLGKAILANPIFLIAAIVVAVGAAFILLKDKVKILSEAFAFLSNIVGGVIQFFKDLSDELGLTAFAAEESADRQIAAAQKVRASAEENYDAEIALRKAAGEETFKIEQEKQKVIQKSIDDELEGIQKKIEASGDYVDGQRTATEEQKKQIAELEKARRDSALAQRISEITEAKKAADELAKIAEDNAKKAETRRKERLAKQKQQQDEYINAIKDLYGDLSADILAIEDAQDVTEEEKITRRESRELEALDKKLENAKKAGASALELKVIQEESETAIAQKYALIRVENQKALDAQIKEEKDAEKLAAAELKIEQDETDLQARIDLLTVQRDIDLENENLTASEKLLIKEKYKNDVKAINDEIALSDVRTAQQALDVGKATNDSLIALSDAFFSIKTRNLAKGSVEEEKAAKKQFQTNKALALSSAIIIGTQSVLSAYANGVKNPVPLLGPATGAIYAVIAGVTAAANIAKIASSQYKSSGGGGAVGATGAAPAQPAGIAAAAGSNATPTPKLNDFSLYGTAGKANNASQAQTQKLSVSVDEISSTTKRVDGYKSASELK